jgi:hypothetical protein
MLSKLFITLFITISVLSSKAQTKFIFNRNIAFTIPADWYMKDSTDKRILLRKNGDIYSKIEIKIYEHKSKDLTQYLALDRKKLSPDKHMRSILPDLAIGGKSYKKVKYFNSNKVVIANTEIEHVCLFKPKFPLPKITTGRLEIVLTCSNKQEAEFIKTVNGLLAGLKW